jgi:hypothetical protein
MNAKAEIQLGIRPSAMPRIMACAGSAKAAASMGPQPDNEHTLLGRKRHDGMALMLRMGAKAGATKLAQDSGWTAEDIAITGVAYNLAVEILANYPLLEIEHELDLGFLGITEGERRADVLGYNDTTKTALVNDWKFGSTETDDPEINWQVLTYAAGWVAELLKLGHEVEAVELVVIQPKAWKADDKMRSFTMPVKDVRANALKILDGVKLAKMPNAPRIPSDKACQFCAFKEQCPEKQGLLKQEKAQKTAERQELVASGKGIMVLAEKGFDIQLPLVVVSEELVQQVDDMVAEAMAIKVVDAVTANQAGELSKRIRKLNKAIDDNRKEVGEPLLFYKRKVDAAPKACTNKLDQADDYLQDQVQQLLAAEAEAQRLADELAEKERKALEDAEASAAAAARARKPENKEALEQQALLLTNEAKELALQQMATPQGPPRVTQVAGFKAAPTVSLTINDLGLVPPKFARMLLMVDEKKVKAALAAGHIKEADVEGWGSITSGTAARRS